VRADGANVAVGVQAEAGSLVDVLADVAVAHDAAPARARASAAPEEARRRLDTRARHMACVHTATLRRCSVSASKALTSEPSSFWRNQASAAASAGASSSLAPTSSPRFWTTEANESTIRASNRS
jgi:hypothetical protein